MEDEGERQIPCECCGEKAFYETVTNGIYVCESEACMIEYVMDNCLATEVTEEDHQEYGALVDEDVEDVF